MVDCVSLPRSDDCRTDRRELVAPQMPYATRARNDKVVREPDEQAVCNDARPRAEQGRERGGIDDWAEAAVEDQVSLIGTEQRTSVHAWRNDRAEAGQEARL